MSLSLRTVSLALRGMASLTIPALLALAIKRTKIRKPKFWFLCSIPIRS